MTDVMRNYIKSKECKRKMIQNHKVPSQPRTITYLLCGCRFNFQFRFQCKCNTVLFRSQEFPGEFARVSFFQVEITFFALVRFVMQETVFQRTN